MVSEMASAISAEASVNPKVATSWSLIHHHFMRIQTLRLGPILVSALLCCPSSIPTSAQTDLVGDIRAQLAQNSFSAAESELRTYKAQRGVTPEYLEALSWMARGAAATRQWDQAAAYATETRRLAEQQLATTKRKLDAEPHLPIALGAAYEVLAQGMAAKGQQTQAVSLLRSALARYGSTSIRARVQKNLNLLASGRTTRAALTSDSISGTEAAASGIAEGFARSFIFLGALVCGLQSGSPRHSPLTSGVRSRRPGGHRTHPTLRLRRPRSRCLARTGASVHRIRPRTLLRQPARHAGPVEQTKLQRLWSEYDADSGRPESRRASGDVSSGSYAVRRTASSGGESGAVALATSCYQVPLLHRSPSAAEAACVAGFGGMAEAMPFQSSSSDRLNQSFPKGPQPVPAAGLESRYKR